MDIFISLSLDSETIDTLNETKSSSILSSFIAATKSSSVKNKNKSDKDIKIEIDNMFLNN
jgi:hypothetical protein